MSGGGRVAGASGEGQGEGGDDREAQSGTNGKGRPFLGTTAKVLVVVVVVVVFIINNPVPSTCREFFFFASFFLLQLCPMFLLCYFQGRMARP